MSTPTVKTIFTEILALNDDVEWADVRYQHVEGWDSLAHMAIVAELEDRFDVLFETDDIVGMSSFDRALEILRGYGVDEV
jgi:acyl carrier protein